MTPRGPLYCDDPEEHGCGRRQAPGYPKPAPVIPDLAPGYRYDQAAVNEASEVLTRGGGPSYDYQDDPRNIVQDILDIFTDHGGLITLAEVDIGYEAVIIDLSRRLAAAEDDAATYRHAHAWCAARGPALRVCRVPGCNCNRPRYV